MAVRTLREVYGVAEPAELRFRYAVFGSGDGEDLGLGLEPEERPLRPRSKPPRRPSAGALSPIVEDGLRRWLRVDRLERDADGDFFAGGRASYVVTRPSRRRRHAPRRSLAIHALTIGSSIT